MTKKWNYRGDINLAEGGLYWRRVDPNDDYVEAVDVYPFPGTDDLFYVVSDIIFMPDNKLETALECCGYKLVDGGILECTGHVETDTLPLKVDAFYAFHGLDDTGYAYKIIRGGPMDHPFNHRLRPNASLRKFVERAFLR